MTNGKQSSDDVPGSAHAIAVRRSS